MSAKEKQLGGKTSADPRLARLKRLGIETWPQALLCLPQSYQDFSKFSLLSEALPRDGVVSEPRLFALVVSERPVTLTQPKRRIVLTATDGMHSAKLVIFVVAGVDTQFWSSLKVGDRIHVRASLQSWAGRLQITGPSYISDEMVGRVVPKYPSRRGVVGAGAIHDAASHAILSHAEEAAGLISEALGGMPERDILRRARIGGASLCELLGRLHAPDSLTDAELALAEARRLAAFSVVYQARQMRRKVAIPESSIPVSGAIVDKLIARLPYPLTSDQKTAIDEIVADLSSPYPMRRVLSGDTGCGKTYAFMVPALAAQIAGRSVAILTPNSLLAGQFVAECREAFGEKVPVQAVIGGQKIDLPQTGNPILVGTTALLSRFRDIKAAPDMLVIDEQQRFGVGQKEELVDARTNLIEATATPIPRTTALVTHGGLDVSIIKKSPVEKSVASRIVAADEAKRLFEHTRKILDSGGQVAVVYPIVRDHEQERKSVVQAFKRWSHEFPGRVGMIHGAMKEDEKAEAVAKLKSGQHAVGVVSSIIEIGLTLPSLKSLIVVHAERYGVSTLHQFRGRLARLGGNGYFFMYLPSHVSEETMARLRLVEECNDGFELAERDAQMRGYGDLIEGADRQHGKSRSTLFIGANLGPADIHQFAQHKD